MIYIVQSLWNSEITSSLAKAAQEELSRASRTSEIVQAPGALEIPLVIKWLWSKAQRSQQSLDGFVACGCVVEGSTHHFLLVANESSRALMDLSLELRIPIGHAILCTYKLEQAWERSGEENNKGREAALAVLDMLDLKKSKEL